MILRSHLESFASTIRGNGRRNQSNPQLNKRLIDKYRIIFESRTHWSHKKKKSNTTVFSVSFSGAWAPSAPSSYGLLRMNDQSEICNSINSNKYKNNTQTFFSSIEPLLNIFLNILFCHDVVCLCCLFVLFVLCCLFVLFCFVCLFCLFVLLCFVCLFCLFVFCCSCCGGYWFAVCWCFDLNR